MRKEEKIDISIVFFSKINRNVILFKLKSREMLEKERFLIL